MSALEEYKNLTEDELVFANHFAEVGNNAALRELQKLSNEREEQNINVATLSIHRKKIKMNKDTVIKAMDLDEWKHSIKNKLETKEDLEKALDIIDKKFDKRTADLVILRQALLFLVDEIDDWEKYYEQKRTHSDQRE